MERKPLQPHEVFCASWDEIFKPFFNRMETYEKKTKSAEHAAEERGEGEEKEVTQ